MNRDNIRAIRAGRSTTAASENVHHYQTKELCVVWLPERAGYFQGLGIRVVDGKAVRTVRTCAASAQATVYSGDDATRIAEQIMCIHGLKPVLRAHYGRTQ